MYVLIDSGEYIYFYISVDTQGFAADAQVYT